MEKKIGKRWYFAGRKQGFGIGFNASKYGIDMDLGFWFVAVEL
jgi:hypothetical protein